MISTLVLWHDSEFYDVTITGKRQVTVGSDAQASRWAVSSSRWKCEAESLAWSGKGTHC